MSFLDSPAVEVTDHPALCFRCSQDGEPAVPGSRNSLDKSRSPNGRNTDEFGIEWTSWCYSCHPHQRVHSRILYTPCSPATRIHKVRIPDKILSPPGLFLLIDAIFSNLLSSQTCHTILVSHPHQGSYNILGLCSSFCTSACRLTNRSIPSWVPAPWMISRWT